MLWLVRTMSSSIVPDTRLVNVMHVSAYLVMDERFGTARMNRTVGADHLGSLGRMLCGVWSRRLRSSGGGVLGRPGPAVIYVLRGSGTCKQTPGKQP